MIRRKRFIAKKRQLNRAPNRRTALSRIKRKIRQRRHVLFSFQSH
ncbi:MAG: hypothetical protein ACRCRW_15715 [Aeromonadaceae bacterium]